MKKNILLQFFGFCLIAASAFGYTPKQMDALDLFGISVDQIEQLEHSPRLNLNFEEDSKLFSKMLTVIQIAQLSNLEIAKGDESKIPSYISLGKTMAQTNEVSLAMALLQVDGFCVALNVLSVDADNVMNNFGMDPSSGFGFTGFYSANAHLFELQRMLGGQGDMSSIESSRASQKITEMLFEAATHAGSDGLAFAGCGGSVGIGLTDNKCCEGSSDGVSQQCDDATDKKCGIFRRNGTIVCRIASDDC